MLWQNECVQGSCYQDKLTSQTGPTYASCTHSFIQREREHIVSGRRGGGGVNFFFFSSPHMTTWWSALPPSVRQFLTSCCTQFPSQRVGERRGGSSRCPSREWRRRNALWDGAEDPPHLRTQAEKKTWFSDGVESHRLSWGRNKQTNKPKEKKFVSEVGFI